jgi:hypothetical protein
MVVTLQRQKGIKEEDGAEIVFGQKRGVRAEGTAGDGTRRLKKVARRRRRRPPRPNLLVPWLLVLSMIERPGFEI